MTADMSYDEAKEVMDQMLDRLLFDVPEEYYIDRDHYDSYPLFIFLLFFHLIIR